MQSRDSMSLTDRESSSDESDCSLEAVQSFARGTPRKRNAKCGGEKPAAKQSREEGEKGADTPNDTETAKRDNEVVTSGKQTAATSELTPADSRCAEGKTQAARVWCAESEQSNLSISSFFYTFPPTRARHTHHQAEYGDTMDHHADPSTSELPAAIRLHQQHPPTNLPRLPM